MALTKQDKKMIDLVIPLSVAGFAGFFAFKKSKDWRLITVAVIAAFVLFYALTSQVTKRLNEKGPGPVDIPNATGSGSECDDFDPMAICGAIWRDVDGVNLSRNHDIYDQLIGLSDCKLLKVYNYWNKNYYKENDETLPAAIADELSYTQRFDNQKSTIKAIFNRLNLQ